MTRALQASFSSSLARESFLFSIGYASDAYLLSEVMEWAAGRPLGARDLNTLWWLDGWLHRCALTGELLIVLLIKKDTSESKKIKINK